MLGTTPEQKRHGVTPEISSFLQHKFWDPILYYDHEAAWLETKERSGRWVGVAENIGDVLTYWIIDDQSKQLLARSVVRPFWGNKRVKWDPDFVKAPFKNTAHNAMGGGILCHLKRQEDNCWTMFWTSMMNKSQIPKDMTL